MYPFEVHIWLVTQSVEVDVRLPRNQKLVLMIFRNGISISFLTKDIELDKNICKTRIKCNLLDVLGMCMSVY